MEGSSSRRALMAEIYRVMMSEVLTPTGEEQRESRVVQHRMAWIEGVWMVQALCSI